MKKIITIIIFAICMQNATAQNLTEMFNPNAQTTEQYTENFIKISVAFAAIPKERTDFDGFYTKINTDYTMTIQGNQIVFQSIYYPNLNNPFYARASSYNNSLDNATTTTTTYSFLKSENNVFLVFGCETFEKTDIGGIAGVYGIKPKWQPELIKTATYYDEKIRLNIGKIIGDIIIINGTYYIKQGPKN